MPTSNWITVDFQFNPKMNRKLVFDLAAAGWVGRREDALFLGPPGSGKSHCAQAIATLLSSKATACCIAKLTRCWRNWPMPTLDGSANST